MHPLNHSATCDTYHCSQRTERLWLALHLVVLLLMGCIGFLYPPPTPHKSSSHRNLILPLPRSASVTLAAPVASPADPASQRSSLVDCVKDPLRVQMESAQQGSSYGLPLRSIPTRFVSTSWTNLEWNDAEWSENEWENSETEDPLLGNCGCPNVSNDLRGVAIPSHLPSDGISEVWELSSRHLPDRFRAINSQAPGLTAQRHTASGWIRDDLENALIDDGRLTIVYVHGNFMERNNSLNRVLIIDDYLRRRTNRPYRILMLSWPSTREPHPLRDVFENAESAECQALYVAWLLERLGTRSEVALLGFSFGARAVTGGLHFASGGTVPGFTHRSVAGPEGIQSQYRVAMVAPAVDRDWLAVQGRHSHAMDRVTGLINLYNSRDPILRRFRFIDRLSRPVAAGFAGFIGVGNGENVANPRATQPLANSARIRQFDCGSIIGTTHSERSYYGECPYFTLVLDHLLGNAVDGTNGG